MLDVNKIRSDFKMYSVHENLVYLDSGATSLTPDCVVEKMSDYYYTYRATVHRTKYKIGEKADTEYINSRKIIANFINAKFEEVVFTKSTTTALNNIAREITKDLDENSHILVSELDHHSCVLPFREYANDLQVDYIKLDDDYKITVENFIASLHENTRVVVLNHVSNVLGDVTPIKEISKICKERNIIFVVDGAQAITHEKIDVKDLGVDFYVFSGHKMCGPTGIGVCYINHDYKNDIRFEYGGDMTVNVTKYDALYAERPIGLEAGTPSIAEVLGLARACQYLDEIGLDNIHQHILELKKYFIEQVSDIEDLIVYNPDSKSGIITFNIIDRIKNDGSTYSAHDVLEGLQADNDMICIRGGHMCNLLTLSLLNTYDVLRASIYIYNNKQDIDSLISQLKKIICGEINIIGLPF